MTSERNLRAILRLAESSTERTDFERSLTDRPDCTTHEHVLGWTLDDREPAWPAGEASLGQLDRLSASEEAMLDKVRGRGARRAAGGHVFNRAEIVPGPDLVGLRVEHEDNWHPAAAGLLPGRWT